MSNPNMYTGEDHIIALEAEIASLRADVARLRDAIAKARKVKFAGSCCGCGSDTGFTKVQKILADTEPKS